MKRYKLLLISANMFLLVTNVQAWSDITYLDMPPIMNNGVDQQQAQAIVVDPKPGQDPSTMNMITAGTTIKENGYGYHLIYAYRSPYVFTPICEFFVGDTATGIFNTTRHYCVVTQGYCSVGGENAINGSMTITFAKPNQTSIHSSNAGNCSQTDTPYTGWPWWGGSPDLNN